ncbi:hypothetical protein [Solirubrum puertoriconensis]|uniref:Uncharacterized protein n=1 Tax=Solirubrum puertoriconensis TaxID=1751427 RepID=A0A9X0HK92_SOLP1|nr:hypothetical protein [Solirubrum puertoriconensis]KUG07498.1 hypothetical protein ASU33_14225 [Solirubrum puertoriconensis]
MKSPFLLLAAGLMLAPVPAALAQGPGNHKDKKEYKGGKDKEYKDGDDEDRDDDDDDRGYERRDNGRYSNRKGSVGGILGRVIFPPTGSGGPRRLEGVPRGHYPPPGQCRIWYPNRPPGHQPPPTDCRSLIGRRLEPGAFILHGNQAYDAEYDWRAEERRRPGSVVQDVLDILFPRS